VKKHLSVDVSGFLRGIEGGAQHIANAAMSALLKATWYTEEQAKGTHLFKDRSGRTRQSIKAKVNGWKSGFVKAGGAALFIENGTKAHVIRGNPYLRFTVNGQTLFRRMVHHPGTAPRPFMQEAADRGAVVFRLAAEHYVGEAIRRMR
jgi:hypothetical protein